MEFTGERFIPGQTDIELEMEHMNRYQFARQFVKGKRVLDAACGAGFGTDLLARDADFVTGIDISEESIFFAEEKYGGSRVSFQVASVEKLPFPDSSFDVVVSFETLEHVDGRVQEAFVSEIGRVLTADGILVMSTPNHSVYSKRGNNEFHVKELDYAEFKDLLAPNFLHVRFFSQQFEVCNAIVAGKGASAWAEGGLSSQQAEYLVAVCYKNHGPKEIASRVVVRSDNELSRLVTWAVENHELNQNNNASLAKLREQLAEEQSTLTAISSAKNQLAMKLQKKSDQIEQLLKSEQRLQTGMKQYSARIAEQEEALAKAHIQAHRLEERVHTLETDLNNKEGWIHQLIQSERDLKQEIINKEGNIQQLLEPERELNRIKASRSWRLMGYIWRIQNFFIPRGSKRRLMGKMLVKFVKHPLRFMSKCTPKRIGKFFYILRREGTQGVSRRLDDLLADRILPQTEIVVQGLMDGAPAVKKATDYVPLSVPHWDKPMVSIVIPVYNQFDYTYLCIKSIIANSGDVPYEIIVADDCSTDVTREIDTMISGLHVMQNTENLRFLRNCNHAAKLARGQYILFLNNDTQVQENWLQPLADLLENDETIGITGSKLVYPDGRLQEAGGIFWKDGSAWNYGNRSNPDLPEYNYVKEVDYISGASICIRRTLWEEIGGFDERFAPAYCEDSDLAFEVRKRGYKVIYQPLSVVVHFEGVSNGTDLSSGQKAYQAVNQKKFFEKWKDELETEHFPNGENVFLARDRSRRKKTLLMVDHYVPMYDKDAGSRTVYQYIQLLVYMGYNVKFIGDNYFPHQPYTKDLQQMGVEVLVGPYYADHWRAWMKENGNHISYVFLSRPHISVKYIDEVRKHTTAKIVYYGHDLHFLRERREYELTGDTELLKSSQNWEKTELALMNKSDVVFTLSEDERKIINSALGKEKAIISPIFYYESVPHTALSFARRKDILFVGGFNHKPNEDGVVWFAKNLWPHIRAALPECRFIIAGSNPTGTVKALASEDIQVTGYLTDEELNEKYETCRVCVIPLRYGAGVKGKTIEAMYHRIPIVSTSIGIEGLPGIAQYLKPYDKENEFVDQVIGLYLDENLAVKEAEGYCEYVQKHFSRDNALELFSRVFSGNRNP